MNPGDEITYDGERYRVLSSGATVHDIRKGKPVVGLITHLINLDTGKRRMVLNIDREIDQ